MPVYNVAMPLLRKRHPDRAPFRLIEIPLNLADRRGEDGPPPSPVPEPVETAVAR